MYFKLYFLSLCMAWSSIQMCSTSPVHGDWRKDESITHCRGMVCSKWNAIQQEIDELRKLNQINPGQIDPDAFGVKQEDSSTLYGDIWPSLDLVTELKEKFQTRHKRKMATFTSSQTRWEMPIHYYLDDNFTETQKDAIRGAVAHWEAQTCIRFIELDYSSAVIRIIMETPFLYFMLHESSCGTFVGHMPDTIVQPVFLAPKCIEQWGAIVHEIGHVVGFWHEHQRSDRNDFVFIFPDRMLDPGMTEKQFNAVSNTRNLVEYDYGSVMHYWAWTNSGSFQLITIQPKDPLYLYTIGQKISLSFLDAKLANIEYCLGKCTEVVPCENGGYQDPNDCSRCKCPDGFTGRFCDILEPCNGARCECGGVISLGPDKESTFISSPGYAENVLYPDRTSCTWRIRAPEGYKVNLKFMNQPSDHFSMFCKYPVCFHWVEVKVTNDRTKTGPRFCCATINREAVLPDVMTSEGNEMMILMRSNYSTSEEDKHYKQGFRAFLTITEDKDKEVSLGEENGDANETPDTPNSEPRKNLDIIFVMDSSGSVGSSDWSKLLDFSTNIISRLSFGANDYRYAFVTFGSSGYLDVSLSETNHVTVQSKIKALKWKGESSNVADGLRKARAEVLSSRSDSPNLVVMVTDGPATAEQSQTETEARLLKEVPDTTLLILGVTDRVTNDGAVVQELRNMASRPVAQFLQMFPNFYSLDAAVSQVASIAEQIASAKIEKGLDNKLTSSTTTTATKPTTTTPTTPSITSITTSTTTSVTTTSQKAFCWRCTFESDFCGMINEETVDQFDWTRHRGRTPSDNTGPDSAADGEYFIYIEASSPRRAGDTATIYTPDIPEEGMFCLRYQYHMYGHHIRELLVHVVGVAEPVDRLEKQGVDGVAAWKTRQLSLTLPANASISFTGTRGDEYSGDIAVDDISLCNGPCYT